MNLENIIWSDEVAPSGIRQVDGRIGLIYLNELERGYLIVTKDELLRLVGERNGNPLILVSPPGPNIFLGRVENYDDKKYGELIITRDGLEILTSVVQKLESEGKL